MTRFTYSATLLLLALSCCVDGLEEYHGKAQQRLHAAPAPPDRREQSAEYWREEARAELARQLRAAAGADRPARNVVLFLGDGMSPTTLTAARLYRGQHSHPQRHGEDARLAFDDFPTVGLSKTYCVDAQTADSACSATAYLCGVKANQGTLGVTARVPRWDCRAARDPDVHVDSIATWALEDGRDAGIVTTTRVTHASPAGAYAHSAERNWESDADVAASCAADAQDDIAKQLIHSYPGNRFKVILGGGRREFLPNSTVDEEGAAGRRLDGRDLIAEWRAARAAAGQRAQYVWNRDQLLAASARPPDALLGLFEDSHMQYHLEADPATEPTLAELTEAAIRVLSRNPRGFFLFVEGGRIDHAHHENRPRLALDETDQLSDAVARAARLLDDRDSLLLVTADHSHVMAFNGYAYRNSDILGPSDEVDDAGVPYMTLSYANGPGFRPHVADGVRDDISQLDYKDIEFRFEAGTPLELETHGGEDVAVFARGPQHAAFAGVYQQSALPARAAWAACLGPQPHAPACSRTTHHTDTNN